MNNYKHLNGLTIDKTPYSVYLYLYNQKNKKNDKNDKNANKFNI